MHEPHYIAIKCTISDPKIFKKFRPKPQKFLSDAVSELILYQSLYRSTNNELDFFKVKETYSASTQVIKNGLEAGIKV